MRGTWGDNMERLLGTLIGAVITILPLIVILQVMYWRERERWTGKKWNE